MKVKMCLKCSRLYLSSMVECPNCGYRSYREVILDYVEEVKHEPNCDDVSPKN